MENPEFKKSVSEKYDLPCLFNERTPRAAVCRMTYNYFENFRAALTWSLTQNVAASEDCLKNLLPSLQIAGDFEFRSKAFYRLCERPFSAARKFSLVVCSRQTVARMLFFRKKTGPILSETLFKILGFSSKP